jgi:peroxiredoxin
MTVTWRTCFLGIVACAALAVSGCEKKPDSKTTVPKSGAQPAERPAAQPKSPDRTTQPPHSQPEPSSAGEPKAEPSEIKPASSESPVDEAPAADMGQIDPADLVMPRVLLSHAEAETCLVGVGDLMPAITLPDLAGKEESLAKLLGERLTVVLFWHEVNPYSVAELADLQRDVAARFGKRGVHVVAIDELDKPEQVRQTVQKLGVKFPVLLDADGQALAKLATRHLPRTYLLDASGKIVWLDIEYSRSTWRDLRQSIQFLLSQE